MVPSLLPRRSPHSIYVGRVLRLTLLAPDIVEAILSGRQSANLTLALLMRSFPVEWQEQRAKISARHAS